MMDLLLDTRYFYNNTLSGQEKRLYRFMASLLLERRYKFYYVIDPALLPDDKSPEIPRFFLSFGPSDESCDLEKTIEALHWDFPEIFYANALFFEVDPDYLVHLGGKRMPVYTDEEIDEISRALHALSHRFDLISDEFELELAVHDYITREFDYDDLVDERTGREYKECFNVVGLIKRGVGVCGALSFLMQFILQQHGITVANIVKALADDDEIYHSWLAVRIDGKFYHVDITFDEAESTSPDEPQYTSFNITDDEIFETHSALGDAYPNIVCNSIDANYYVRKGLYFKTAEALIQAMKDFIFRYRDSSRDTLYFYFRTPHITEAREITAKLKEVAEYAKGLGITFRDIEVGVNSQGYGAVSFLM